jgi:hypothetical protein
MKRLIITEGEKIEILSLYNLSEETSVLGYTGITDYPGDAWEFEKPIMKQNIYKTEDGENKDPFIVYRKK